MSYSDLDGDKYFVSWEPTILPERTEDPTATDHPPSFEQSQFTTSPIHRGVQTGRAADVGEACKTISESLMKVFLEQHYGMTLGLSSNDWKDLAENFNDEMTWGYCMILADIVQEALVGLFVRFTPYRYLRLAHSRKLSKMEEIIEC